MAARRLGIGFEAIAQVPVIPFHGTWSHPVAEGRLIQAAELLHIAGNYLPWGGVSTNSMKRTVRNFVVAIVCLATSGAGSARERPQVQSPTAVAVGNSALTIKLQGELRDEDGNQLAITTWESHEDGGWTVTVIHNEFSTPIGAQEYLDKQVAAHAVRVIKRGKARWRGKTDGRRVELIIRGIGGNGHEGEGPAVLRTDGRQFYEILSDSFAHISRLENPPKP
jgi:hypothetical protein